MTIQAENQPDFLINDLNSEQCADLMRSAWKTLNTSGLWAPFDFLEVYNKAGIEFPYKLDKADIASDEKTGLHLILHDVDCNTDSSKTNIITNPVHLVNLASAFKLELPELKVIDDLWKRKTLEAYHSDINGKTAYTLKSWEVKKAEERTKHYLDLIPWARLTQKRPGYNYTTDSLVELIRNESDDVRATFDEKTLRRFARVTQLPHLVILQSAYDLGAAMLLTPECKLKEILECKEKNLPHDNKVTIYVHMDSSNSHVHKNNKSVYREKGICSIIPRAIAYTYINNPEMGKAICADTPDLLEILSQFTELKEKDLDRIADLISKYKTYSSDLTVRIVEHVRDLERQDRERNGFTVKALKQELGIKDDEKPHKNHYVLGNLTKIKLEKQRSYGEGTTSTTVNIDTKANRDKLLPLNEEELKKHALAIEALRKHRISEGLDLLEEDVHKAWGKSKKGNLTPIIGYAIASYNQFPFLVAPYSGNTNDVVMGIKTSIKLRDVVDVLSKLLGIEIEVLISTDAGMGTRSNRAVMSMLDTYYNCKVKGPEQLSILKEIPTTAVESLKLGTLSDYTQHIPVSINPKKYKTIPLELSNNVSLVESREYWRVRFNQLDKLKKIASMESYIENLSKFKETGNRSWLNLSINTQILKWFNIEMGDIDYKKVDEKLEVAGVETSVTNYPGLINNYELFHVLKKGQTLSESIFRLGKDELEVAPFRSKTTIFTIAMLGITFRAVFMLRALQIKMQSSELIPKDVNVTREKICKALKEFSVTHSSNPIYKRVNKNEYRLECVSKRIYLNSTIKDTFVSGWNRSSQTCISNLDVDGVDMIIHLLTEKFRNRLPNPATFVTYQVAKDLKSDLDAYTVLYGNTKQTE